MSLLLIIFLTLLIAVLVFLASWGICLAIYDNIKVNSLVQNKWKYYEKVQDKGFLTWLIPLIIGVCAWVGFIFVGVQLNTNSHKAYLQKYLIQKETIEMSLESDNLSGFERVELVKQATELNGELAEKKAYIKYWYSGVNDNTIYDDVQYINLNKGE